MISFEGIQIGKLYLMDSFDYDYGKYYITETILILGKYIDESRDHQEVVSYLSGTKEYSIYFHYGKFSEIET